jgi:uncharacterized iron-regulated membrane protein
MMTGTLGVLMWLIMIVMLLGMAAGSIAWTRRRRNTHSARPRPLHRGQAPTGRTGVSRHE